MDMSSTTDGVMAIGILGLLYLFYSKISKDIGGAVETVKDLTGTGSAVKETVTKTIDVVTEGLKGALNVGDSTYVTRFGDAVWGKFQSIFQPEIVYTGRASTIVDNSPVKPTPQKEPTGAFFPSLTGTRDYLLSAGTKYDYKAQSPVMPAIPFVNASSTFVGNPQGYYVNTMASPNDSYSFAVGKKYPSIQTCMDDAYGRGFAKSRCELR